MVCTVLVVVWVLNMSSSALLARRSCVTYVCCVFPSRDDGYVHRKRNVVITRRYIHTNMGNNGITVVTLYTAVYGSVLDYSSRRRQDWTVSLGFRLFIFTRKAVYRERHD